MFGRRHGLLEIWSAPFIRLLDAAPENMHISIPSIDSTAYRGSDMCIMSSSQSSSSQSSSSQSFNLWTRLVSNYTDYAYFGKLPYFLLLIDPLVLGALPVQHLLGLEPQGDLLLSVLNAVAAVADVTTDINGVVAANGSRGRCQRVGGAKESYVKSASLKLDGERVVRSSG